VSLPDLHRLGRPGLPIEQGIENDVRVQQDAFRLTLPEEQEPGVVIGERIWLIVTAVFLRQQLPEVQVFFGPSPGIRVPTTGVGQSEQVQKPMVDEAASNLLTADVVAGALVVATGTASLDHRPCGGRYG
jgi:hypothetical protein